MYRAAVLLVVAFAAIIVAAERPMPMRSIEEDLSAYPKNVSYRLPLTTLPLRYDVDLTWIDDVQFNFKGRVIIDVLITQPTGTIVLHKKWTDIQNVTLISNESGGKIMPTTWTYSNVTDFLSVIFNGTMYPGSVYTLDISYNGTLQGANRGFFRQSYVAENGERRQAF